jgi:hypothetical protein
MVFMTLPMIMSVASSITSTINTGSSATNAMAGVGLPIVGLPIVVAVVALAFIMIWVRGD